MNWVLQNAGASLRSVPRGGQVIPGVCLECPHILGGFR